MDFGRLKYFLAIADSGTMSSAAKILKVSPPALSKAMAILEAEVGRELFIRSGRNVLLTESARRLLPKVRTIVSDAENLAQTLDLNPNPRSLRIGTFEVFSTYALSNILREIGDKFDLELHELVPGQMEAAITNRSIDYGVTYLPIPRSGLEFVKVGDVRMGIFATLEFASHFRAAPLEKLPFVIPISPDNETPTRIKGLDGWPDDRVKRWTKYRVTLMESALNICRASLASAFLPTFVAELHNEVVQREFRLLELPVKAPRVANQSVYLIKRQDTPEDAGMRMIARWLRHLCRD